MLGVWAHPDDEGYLSAALMAAASIPRTPTAELAIAFAVTGELLDLKERAMIAQESQSADLRAAVGADRYRQVLGEEVYRHH
ncbi:MAG: hypothetical protein ACT4OX_02230 [Actinomycetota bacterium]